MWFVYVLYLLVCFCVSGLPLLCFFFFFNDTATTEIYTLSLHDALPISRRTGRREYPLACLVLGILRTLLGRALCRSMRSEEHTSELQSRLHLVCRLLLEKKKQNTSTLLPITQLNDIRCVFLAIHLSSTP